MSRAIRKDEVDLWADRMEQYIEENSGITISSGDSIYGIGYNFNDSLFFGQKKNLSISCHYPGVYSFDSTSPSSTFGSSFIYPGDKVNSWSNFDRKRDMVSYYGEFIVGGYQIGFYDDYSTNNNFLGLPFSVDTELSLPAMLAKDINNSNKFTKQKLAYSGCYIAIPYNTETEKNFPHLTVRCNSRFKVSLGYTQKQCTRVSEKSYAMDTSSYYNKPVEATKLFTYTCDANDFVVCSDPSPYNNMEINVPNTVPTSEYKGAYAIKFEALPAYPHLSIWNWEMVIRSL